MFDVGIDIEDITRFKKYSLEKDEYFLKSIFSDNELEYCFSKELPAKHLCARFCAKEAFYKAVNVYDNDTKFCDIQILNDESGKPYFVLPEKFQHLSVKLSLSHDKDKAVACVIISK